MAPHTENDRRERILVPGGAGYVGSLLVPALIGKGYEVTVLDWFIFEPRLFVDDKSNKLKLIKGDIRNADLVGELLQSTDAVIHLAAMSNDPSADLNPKVTEDINFIATVGLVRKAKEAGVKRFILASSASVYGIQDKPATEDAVCKPLTIYSQCKLRSENEILPLNDGDFTATAVRPATLSGFAPRLRLDLVVNNMASQAAYSGKLKVYGGDQFRPNLSVKDMVAVYLNLLEQDASVIGGNSFNISESNHSISEIAEIIKEAPGNRDVTIETSESSDKRSYWVDSNKARRELGFEPIYTVRDSILEISDAVASGLVVDPNLPKYRNVQMLRGKDLSKIVK